MVAVSLFADGVQLVRHKIAAKKQMKKNRLMATPLYAIVEGKVPITASPSCRCPKKKAARAQRLWPVGRECRDGFAYSAGTI